MARELFDLGCAFNEPTFVWAGGLCARPVQVCPEWQASAFI